MSRYDLGRRRSIVVLIVLLQLSLGVSALSSPPLVLALTAPVSGAVAKPDSFIITLPWGLTTGQLTRTVTAGYTPSGGSTRHNNISTRGSTNDYYALDFNLTTSHDVRAVASGTVKWANSYGTSSSWTCFGKSVSIAHDGAGTNYTSFYAHLSSISVPSGTYVQQGQVIGKAGNTGSGRSGSWGSCGSMPVHLHFGLYLGAQTPTSSPPYGGKAVVPEPFRGVTDYVDLRKNQTLTARNYGSTSTVPVAPTNVRATSTSTTAMRLDWDYAGIGQLGFKIFLGGNLIGEKPPDSRFLNNVGMQPNTTYCFTVKAFNAAGDSPASNQACATTLSPPHVDCVDGYTAEYFNNIDLAGTPASIQCESWPIDHAWGDGSPSTELRNDFFSVRWTGRAYFTGGEYTFIASADDGIRVWLDDDDAPLVWTTPAPDAWVDQGETEYRLTKNISAGYHSIKVKYYERAGGATARFRWEQQQVSCSGFTMHYERTLIGLTLTDSVPSHNFCLNGIAGEWASIRMWSTVYNVWEVGLDTIVRVYNPDGTLLRENDDMPLRSGGSTTNSFLSVQLPVTGMYRIEATRWGTSTGEYRLRLELGHEATVGDINRDCVVDQGDADILIAALQYNPSDQNSDLNLNGIVTVADHSILSDGYGLTCP